MIGIGMWNRWLAASLAAVLSLYAAGCQRELRDEALRELITARTLGLAYLEEGRLEEAEAQFRNVIDLEPREALGYANIGLLRLLVYDHAGAEPYLQQALVRATDDADARYLLAQVYLHTDRRTEGVAELEGILRGSPSHGRTLYALAGIAGESGTAADRERQERYLSALAREMPANLPARLPLVEVLLRNGKADEAARHLEELRALSAEFSAKADAQYAESLRLARAGRAEEALGAAEAFHATMRQTTEYAVGIPDLVWQGLQRTGFSAFSRPFDLEFEDELARARLAAIRFTDVTAAAGLDAVAAILAAGDWDGDGDVDLFARTRPSPGEGASTLLWRNDDGRFEPAAEAGVRTDGADSSAIFGDFDNDGWLDLHVVRTGPDRLYRNAGEGEFVEVGAAAGVGGEEGGRAALFFDADHDGDLDLFVMGEGPNRLYRNNTDGTFTERGAASGLAGGAADSRQAAFGDYDRDGDLDLFVANAGSASVLYANMRHGEYQSMGAAGGPVDMAAAAVAAGDYDNDGNLDLFLASPETGRYGLYRNGGKGQFEPDRRSAELERALEGTVGVDASFLDFDNDGFLDLVVAADRDDGVGRELFLFHNEVDRRFVDFSALLPEDLSGAERVVVSDLEDDGDLDLFISGPRGGVRVLRNDGGNANRFLKVRLVGLRAGAGKANHFGIGSRIELRAGELYQAQTVVKPTTHFGLGSRPVADAVRVVWTNGVPQTLFQPRSDQTLVQRQVLKGSCPFVYAWDGGRYTFVTDVMWRSALGMPMGIMGGDQAYAPPTASREYVRIPGTSLREREGHLTVQITEELWEIFYVDEVKLIAVDHPDSIDIYVNERFVPPGPAALSVYQVAHARPPVAAMDGEGNDVLGRLREQDDLYVSNLEPGRYQGVVGMHDLVLDLGEFADSLPAVLYLNGWIFPTDASINVAMAQSRRDSVVAPYLEVIGPGGAWTRAIDDLGFPAGKRKTVIADLTGKFPTADHRVRIRSSMQIYWDRAFLSVGSPTGELSMTPLEPASAHLHFRGFSREYRKGGRYGPHWFDYEQVSTEPRWLPLEGAFTRFGDVRPLLLESDDRYVIMGPGDEATVDFEARRLPALQSGWTRDFLLYTVGWVKDADLNTATGNTVDPLPFHAMTRYPYLSDESYPDNDAHRRYLEEYNTRRFGPGER